MAKVVIFGTQDFAEAAAFYLKEDSPHEVVGLTVESDYVEKDSAFGLDVFPFETLEKRFSPSEFSMFVAVGPSRINKLRARLYGEAKQKVFSLISYVSSKAHCWPGTSIGDNCFIFEGCVVEPTVVIGNDVIMWSGARVAHHSTVKDHCFLAPGATISGRVVVEEFCFLGLNCSVRDHVRVATECVIGVGATIKKDTEPSCVYGQPGTPLSRRDSSEVQL